MTTTYNLEANGKIERGHSPTVKALVKVCEGRGKLCPHMLPYGLWVDQTTHSFVTGYMPVELMTGLMLVMPTETTIRTWGELPWEIEINLEDLLTVWIWQLEGIPKDIAEYLLQHKEA